MLFKIFIAQGQAGVAMILCKKNVYNVNRQWYNKHADKVYNVNRRRRIENMDRVHIAE